MGNIVKTHVKLMVSSVMGMFKFSLKLLALVYLQSRKDNLAKVTVVLAILKILIRQ